MNFFKYLTLITFITLGAFSCTIDDQVDPNNPSLSGVSNDASISQLNNLVTGTMFQMRDQVNVYYDEIGVIGREMYRFSGSDPRWVADLLNGVLDNNAFYTTRVWAARYRTIKNTNILIDAINNTGAPTAAEKEGYLGFAKTIQAHELLIVLNLHNENGIRVDVSDPDNLGPIVSRSEALTFIATLLNEADVHLDNAGDGFAFDLTSGFAGFDTPTTFSQFNRALAARVAAYRGNYSESVNYLNKSFVDMMGDLSTGVYMVFTTSAGDVLNPMFLPQNNTGEVRAAHPTWVSEAEAGDTRANKATLRAAPVMNTNLTSEYDVWRYPSNTTPIPVIRNEELILLYAEAQAQEGNPDDAVMAINTVRNAAGLTDYAGATDTNALMDAVCHERRYSLWMEGHRWVDMRRYNKLGELSLDRPGDLVHESFPIPQDENP